MGTLVLLSGGIDSFASAKFMIEMERAPFCLFIDYGQPAAIQEKEAARRIAAYLSLPLDEMSLVGAPIPPEGEIAGRNLALLSLACLFGQGRFEEIVIGIHAGVDYLDCKPNFISEANRAICSGIENPPQIISPFLNWNKSTIFKYCIERDLPIELTYSCEGGGEPCGKCLSCLDRGELDVGRA